MPNTLEHLAQTLGTALRKKNLLLTTAESCTGGGLSYWITSVGGSSQWFERGFVTYSNEAKIEQLGVKPETLDTYGAVSEQAAREMAEGALARIMRTLPSALPIAGPDGSTPKPWHRLDCLCFAAFSYTNAG